MALQTRQRILDVSPAMLHAQGESNVSPNHIAEQPGISQRTLSYPFRNKDEIPEHVVARCEVRIKAGRERRFDSAPRPNLVAFLLPVPRTQFIADMRNALPAECVTAFIEHLRVK